MEYHLIGFVAGFILDCFFGDPYWLPHPVRFIGKLIAFFDKKLNSKTSKHNKLNGRLTVILVCCISMVLSGGILLTAYLVHPVAGCIVEAIMTYQLLAAKCLKVESMKVYNALKNGTLEEARFAVSMIVGRDTNNLSKEEITKATVETVAENTSDGVIAPMIFLAIAGPVGGFFYKSINTMDSMIGYKNKKYMDFGRAAAKTDDIVNFIPARISALLMIFGCCFLGKKYDGKNAFKIFRRDRYNHQSPNSAQTESACAGALGLKLAGPASYEGIIEDKPFIGDDLRPIEFEDIKKANVLMYVTTVLCLLICSGIMIIGIL